jgi:hypothetical protein
MKTTRKPSRSRTATASRRFVVTLGELISAAYDAVPGFGPQRRERAERLLTHSPLARYINPHVEFVR